MHNFNETEALLNNVRESKNYECVVNKENIVIFGAGFHGSVSYEFLSKEDKNIIAFCDNDKQKQGQIINGIPCISIEELKKIPDVGVFITIKHFTEEVMEQLSCSEIEYILFDTYVFCENIEKIKIVYEMLEDDFSKNTFTTLIEASITGDKSELKDVFIKKQYFCLYEFSDFNNNEVFINCGAFVGDTIEEFVSQRHSIFKKIYAFEPGKKQYEALRIRMKRLITEWALDNDSIECILAGVGEEDLVGYTETGVNDLIGTRFIESNVASNDSVKLYSLDNYPIKEKTTLIVVDIEGYEMKMLKGARNLIKTCKPKIAISIYHRTEDFFEIPMYIKNLVPEYKFKIRHHATSLMDTCLYCYT